MRKSCGQISLIMTFLSGTTLLGTKSRVEVSRASLTRRSHPIPSANTPSVSFRSWSIRNDWLDHQFPYELQARHDVLPCCTSNWSPSIPIPSRFISRWSESTRSFNNPQLALMRSLWTDTRSRNIQFRKSRAGLTLKAKRTGALARQNLRFLLALWWYSAAPVDWSCINHNSSQQLWLIMLICGWTTQPSLTVIEMDCIDNLLVTTHQIDHCSNVFTWRCRWNYRFERFTVAANCNWHPPLSSCLFSHLNSSKWPIRTGNQLLSSSHALIEYPITSRRWKQNKPTGRNKRVTSGFPCPYQVEWFKLSYSKMCVTHGRLRGVGRR